MVHVFVETNWVVDYAAPSHRQTPAARALLARARRGELGLHLPAFCVVQAREVIRKRFQPRGEADAIRQFVRWATSADKLTIPERDAAMRTVNMFESHVRSELDRLDSRLAGLRDEPGLEIFAMDDGQLKLAIDISFVTRLDAFDQSVLAAVLGRSDAIRALDATSEFAFCELDSDLQPWDRQGRARMDLRELYDQRAIWVYGDFDMSAPVRPTNWHPGSR
jgi:predicted nucleic acid-binding protein